MAPDVLLAVTLIASMSLFATVPASAQAERTEGWYEVDVWKRLTATDRLYFPIVLTRAGESGYAEGRIGALFDRRISDLFSARVGYRYLWQLVSSGSSDRYVEHRAMADVTARVWDAAHLTILDRNRVELRWIRGVYSWRLRNRIRGQRGISLRHERSVTPYASVEPGFDSRFSTINRLRTTLGSETSLSSRVGLDMYGWHQRDTRSKPSRLWTLGVTLNLTFF